MILKNQAELNGKINESSFQLLSNESYVEISTSAIIIKETMCHNVLCCCLKIKISIISKGMESIKRAFLINNLAVPVTIAPCTLKINGRKSNYWYKNNRLRIKLPEIKPGRKMVVHFIITRNDHCCNRWKHFDNHSVVRVNNKNFTSNTIRVYNGLRSDCHG